MVTRAPRDDSTQDAPRVRGPKTAAAGNGAVGSIVHEVVTKLGVTRTTLPSLPISPTEWR